MATKSRCSSFSGRKGHNALDNGVLWGRCFLSTTASSLGHIISPSCNGNTHTGQPYRCVIYCESAKEMWDNIIVLFEGSEDTRECRRSLLIKEYNFFACKPGESLTNTYIRFKCIVNELRQYNKTFGNEEMLTKFIRSLPTEWSAMLNMLRETHALKTMSLEVLYGGLLTFEWEKKHDSWLKERVALQDAFSSQRARPKNKENFKVQCYYRMIFSQYNIPCRHENFQDPIRSDPDPDPIRFDDVTTRSDPPKSDPVLNRFV
ncbi:hypothetical protein LXL04_010275 [Taraxacum kok-saghyz]